MSVDIRAALLKMNGRGVEYFQIVRRSPLLSVLFYDTKDLYLGEGKDLKPKTMQKVNSLLQNDGRTIRWHDIDLRPGTLAVNGAASSGDTTLTLADASTVVAGDSIYVPSTGETFVITAKSTNDLTLGTAVGAAGIANEAAVALVGHAIPIGGDGKTFSITASDEQTNYIEDTSVKLPFNIDQLNSLYQAYVTQGDSDDTAIAKMVNQYIGNGISQVFRTIANSFFVGKKAITSIATKDVYTTGGFRTFYPTNTNVGASTATAAWANIINALAPLQKLQVGTGPDSQIVLVLSTSAAQSLSNLVLAGGLDIVRSDMTLKSIGAVITKIETVLGTINIITDPTIEDLEGSTANVGYALIPGLVQLRSNPFAMTIADVSKGTAKPGKYEGITLFAKPQNQVNDFEMELFTNFGFVFGANTIPAGVRIYNVGVVTP